MTETPHPPPLERNNRMNRAAYEQMICEDVEWLAQQPRTLERDHIMLVLRVSADHEYAATPRPPAPPDPLRWHPIETAPVEGKFLVWDGRRMMVMDGHIYSLSVLPETPHHLSGHHWTHWMPLPAPPGAETGDK